MRTQLLVTSVGEDRPGIVARLTEIFVANNANLEESRMAILGGEFAAIMLVSLPAANLASLEKDLAKLQTEGISASARKTEVKDPQRYRAYESYEILLKGADHEGIVHTVSCQLRDLRINIQTVETLVVHAPVSGSPLFQLRAMVQAPPDLSRAQLKESLDKIAAQESVDIELILLTVSA